MMITKMREILTTLSEEAQNAALAKCRELNFDPNRGAISLDESFINLNSARSILMDAIEKQKLLQLPITVQTTLLTHLQAISRFLTGLTNGSDEVVNLVNAIEQLYTAIWQYGLHNLSEEVLGYQTKLNQLKQQDLEVKRLRAELEKGLNLKTEFEQLLHQVQTSAQNLQSTLTASEANATKIQEHVNRAAEVDQRAAAILATIQQNDSVSNQLTASSKTSNAEIAALETKIKEFFSQIDQYRAKVTTVAEDAQQAVQNNKNETESLVSALKDLEGQIKEQIVKATGYSLFHSFQTRQESLARSKKRWAIALASFVALSIGWTVFLFISTTDLNTAFYLKLSMSVPLIYAIAFCNLQYSRERKLEEEYAFKANISISLVPYKDLVATLVDKGTPSEVQKYSTFIIDSISKVFTSPTEKIYDTEKKQKGLTPRNIKQLTPLIEAITKAIKP